MTIIHALINLDLYLSLYIAILSHDVLEKEKLLTFIEQTKALEDEQMCFSNKNKKTANYAHIFKPNKAKQKKQRGEGGIKKEFDSEGDKKKQELKKCKTCRRKHYRDYWHLNKEYFIYHNMGYIATKYPNKSINHVSLSSNKKKLCYIQKVTNCHPISKMKVDQVLESCLI